MDSETPPACRHEYVRIYQRRLKGLDRRLVATKAWLPVGFKMADFSHLGEGSYCFCSKCRARLFPKRTNADRLQARIALAASKEAQAELDAQALQDTFDEETSEDTATSTISIHVEELEVESVDLADLEEGSVLLPDEKDSQLASDD